MTTETLTPGTRVRFHYRDGRYLRGVLMGPFREAGSSIVAITGTEAIDSMLTGREWVVRNDQIEVREQLVAA